MLDLSYASIMSAAAKNILESSRDIVQDFLVPEMKAVKVSVESLSHQVKLSVDSLNHQMDSLRVEIKLRDEKLEQIIRSGLEKVELLIRTGDEKNALAISNLSEKLDEKLAFRDQLASIEARLPRQQ
jgi:hypothetical protein